jgi:uncharacterized protein
MIANGSTPILPNARQIDIRRSRGGRIRYLESAGPLASSILATIEVARVVRRVAPESAAALADLFDSVAILAIDDRIAARAAALDPTNLRTLDAIHLASAIEFGEELAAFVCYDERLAVAARHLGMAVVAPG